MKVKGIASIMLATVAVIAIGLLYFSGYLTPGAFYSNVPCLKSMSGSVATLTCMQVYKPQCAAGYTDYNENYYGFEVQLSPWIDEIRQSRDYPDKIKVSYYLYFENCATGAQPQCISPQDITDWQISRALAYDAALSSEFTARIPTTYAEIRVDGKYLLINPGTANERMWGSVYAEPTVPCISWYQTVPRFSNLVPTTSFHHKVVISYDTAAEQVLYCGDGSCDSGESAATCPEDCLMPPQCGNGVCDIGETSLTCMQDCPAADWLTQLSERLQQTFNGFWLWLKAALKI